MAAKLNEGGDLCSRPGQSFLFWLTRIGDCEISLSGAAVTDPAEPSSFGRSGALENNLENPLEGINSSC